jgi:hypothetical protein
VDKISLQEAIQLIDELFPFEPDHPAYMDVATEALIQIRQQHADFLVDLDCCVVTAIATDNWQSVFELIRQFRANH